MKSKTGPSHVGNRGPFRAESLGVAYTSAMFEAQWSQLLNLLKFPSQCPEFARNRKTLFSILLLWTLLHFLTTPPPYLSILTLLQTHHGVTIASPSQVYPPETHMLVFWRRKTWSISHRTTEAPQPPWSLHGPCSAAPPASWHASHHSIWT